MQDLDWVQKATIRIAIVAPMSILVNQFGWNVWIALFFSFALLPLSLVLLSFVLNALVPKKAGINQEDEITTLSQLNSDPID